MTERSLGINTDYGGCFLASLGKMELSIEMPSSNSLVLKCHSIPHYDLPGRKGVQYVTGPNFENKV